MLYDYTKQDFPDAPTIDIGRSLAHPTKHETTGCWMADTVIVGSIDEPRTSRDTWHRFPFVSFGKWGLNQTLCEQLDMIDINEQEMLWVDYRCEYLRRVLETRNGCKIIALGQQAFAEASKFCNPIMTNPIAACEHLDLLNHL
jgi:hypothetical protein